MIRKLLAVAGYATLAAGLVGVARQRAEAQAIRRGELSPASAASDVPPRARYGPVARWLATYVPDLPSSTLGRLAGAVWAGPLTAIGLALALASGRLPRWSATHRCYVTIAERGPSAIALRAVGAQANTIGQIVVCVRPDPPDVLLAHEAVHVRQMERFGPLTFPLYLWLGARYGYRDHPLERAARLGAQRSRTAPPLDGRPTSR